MSSSNIFGTQLPIGRSLFLSWLIVAFLHAQTGTSFSLEGFSAVELALNAGLLFGYFTAFYAIVTYPIGILGLAFLFFMHLYFWFVYHRSDGLRGWKEMTKEFASIRAKRRKKEIEEGKDSYDWVSIIRRAFEVTAMFAAILFYSQALFHQLALIGLAFAFAYYITGLYALGDG